MRTSILLAVITSSLFLSLISPAQAVDCTSPPVYGPCKALLIRYFYNTATHKCQQFTYSGCGGNANRYNTLLACKAACVHVIAVPVDLQDS
ncbi:PI-stichotoxin-Hcr2o-like [Gastrophryne carolinensis]